MSKELPEGFAADDCAVGWGEAGVLLQFVRHGSAACRSELALPAVAAADLLRALHTELATHEARFGVAWSMHDTAFGAECDRRTGLGPGGETLDAHGADMYRLLKNLPLNGYERSFKLQPGRVLTERFLLGIRREQLSPAQIAAIVDRMGLPADWRAAFEADLARTTFLHFGHEGAGQDTVRKLYQEYAREDAGAASAPVLLYTGYKWDPVRPQRRALSHYRLHPGLDLAAMQVRLDDLLPGRPDLGAACAALVERAAACCDAHALHYVEVNEDGNPRRSCDINLYGAELRIAQVMRVLEDAARCFGIAQEGMAGLGQRLQDATLGHVSAGIGRDGAPFMTVYYSLPD